MEGGQSQGNWNTGETRPTSELSGSEKIAQAISKAYDLAQCGLGDRAEQVACYMQAAGNGNAVPTLADRAGDRGYRRN